MDQSVATVTSKPRPAECRETDISALRAIAQAAVSVELFTIPLYMAAMTSIQGMHQITGKGETFYQGRLWPGSATTAHPETPNEKAYNIIFSVFIEEMLHVQMAANLASRVGVPPDFTNPLLQDENHGWTCYGPDKTVIPHIIDLADTDHPSTIRVNLGAVDHRQVDLFQAIEAPEDIAKGLIKPEAKHKYFPTVPFTGWTPDKTDKDLPMFGTIGHMYLCYYDYLNLRYDDNLGETLWHHVYSCDYVQRDLFNVDDPSGRPKREFHGFETTLVRPSLQRVWDMISAITDQGEGSELPRERPRGVDVKYQADREALEVNYPRYDDKGLLTDSADAVARYDNGLLDHFERFFALGELCTEYGFTTWPKWREDQKEPWRAGDLVTEEWTADEYDLPSPEEIARAMNSLGLDPGMYRTISQAAVGSIAGITTVLDDYWTNPRVSSFPYPSMVGSGDRMAICWALFRKAPDLSGARTPEHEDTLLHACQALDFKNRKEAPNDCATVDVFHSCRGSNACKAQGGCGFVQDVEGGGGCSFALVKSKITDVPARGDDDPVYSAPGDNRCGGFGGCAVPISASQVFPKSGTMRLFDFVEPGDTPKAIGEMPFTRGETVYGVAYRAFRTVMEKRKTPVPEDPPPPNDIRLAFPPST
ncbi:ferritin-like domain-containing protein [Actinosynnema sp. NPDC051121]|nr:hypothetical protein [Saccharothrix sp.]